MYWTAFPEVTEVEYAVSAYFFVSSVSPLLVWARDGELKSVRKIRRRRNKPGETIQFDSLSISEHRMSYEDLNLYLATDQVAGPHFSSSVLRPTMQRILAFIARMYHHHLQATYVNQGADLEQAHSLFEANFYLDNELRLHLTSISASDYDEVAARAGGKALYQEAVSLAHESRTSPELFLRMQQGDSYGQFQLLFSEIEQRRTGQVYDPCTAMEMLNTQTLKSLKRIASLQHYERKQTASHAREMNKYVVKRWSYCKRKTNHKAQSDCIRPTIENRYKIFIEKEHVEPDPDYVESRILQLQGVKVASKFDAFMKHGP